MSDNLPTVWPAEPHTLVKHAILRKYLDAWFPILARQGEILRQQYGMSGKHEILFIDGFAGPGEYTGGEPGSPVIALTAAISHSISFPIPVRMLFIELDEDRFTRLRTVLAPKLEEAKKSKNIHAVEPRQGDCDSVLGTMLDECEAKQIEFGPALAFLDQFGYGAVSMDLIRRILSYPQCEVFTYLNYKDMNRWITDDNKAEAFTRAYGGDEWRDARDLPAKQRRDLLLEKYKWALETRAAAKYVVSFLMYDMTGIPLYWLLFCTNNLRGLEEMKRAMWAVDKTGEFRFSDRDDPSQLQLLEKAYSEDWLVETLSRDLMRKTMTAYEVKEYVLTKTPCYLFKGALAALEREERIKILKSPPGRIAGSFNNDDLGQISIRFEQSLFH
jgi:three-Cys-motif partner protein